MCCCGKPVINGRPGYRWQPNDTPSVRPVDPPKLEAGDVLIYDEPGRCGNLDCHSHHYRLVKRNGWCCLLVRHGGGEECIKARFRNKIDLLEAVGTDRYWLFHVIYYASSEARTDARNKANFYWRNAAAEKRIKTRKTKKGIKVWVEDKVSKEAVSAL